jgi:hypothetical protein
LRSPTEAITEPSRLDRVASDTRVSLRVRNLGCGEKKACLARFARVAGENDMPTLFGYLVALALLLGGGYAGLQWLAAPDAVSTHQRAGEKPAARNLPKKSELKSEKAEFDGGRATAIPGEAGGGSKIGTTVTAATDMEAPHRSDHEGNETETISKPGDPTPGVDNDSANTGRKDDVATTGGTSNLNSEPELRSGKPATVSAEGSQDAEHKNDAQVKDIARTPSEPRSEPGVKPAKQDKRQARRQDERQDQRNVRSSRSRLVMMHLRTIEFPDGHREQQLLPIGRSRRMAVEAEDQW